MIVELCDALMQGDILEVFAIQIGRLRAHTSVMIPEGSTGSGAVAQNFGVLQTGATGLLTLRDRANAVRDHRGSCAR